MKRPHTIERFADNGSFSHYALIDHETGELLWSECPEEELQKVKNHGVIGDVMETLEKYKERIDMYKECFEEFIPVEKQDEANLFLSTYGCGLAKELAKQQR